MSDQKDVVEIIAGAVHARLSSKYPDIEDCSCAVEDAVKALEAKGYTITRGSHGVRHRQEPFESK
jgi:hypothetical protein